MSIISVGIICSTIAIGSYAICKKLSTIITGMFIIIDELRKRGNR